MNNIFQSFKLKEIANSNDWLIKYTSKNEGLLIFGPEMDKIYPDYDITNRFYISCGFKELEVINEIWGEENPCQIYVMYLK